MSDTGASGGAADRGGGASGTAVVYATFPSLAEAERIGGDLVDLGLAACVNIMPGMVSIYVWEGARHRDGEVAMIAKTRASLAPAVVEAVRARHPYANPALLVLPVSGGSDAFLGWIAAQTATAPPHRNS